MDDYLNYKSYRIREKVPEEKVPDIIQGMESIPGIEKFKCSGQVISFIYNPYEICEKEILNGLSTLGLIVGMADKNSFKSRLSKMAKDNKENFGGKRLDCCDMDK